LAISEKSLGSDHPHVAIYLDNLAQLLQATNRLAEAEPFYRRALAIAEGSFGPDHPDVATSLNNLARLLQATNRLAEAELLMRRPLAIFTDFERKTRHPHPHRDAAIGNYAVLLAAMGRSEAEIRAAIAALMSEGGTRTP
jgi:tetratricopeptide (TPR) repeat protein